MTSKDTEQNQPNHNRQKLCADKLLLLNEKLPPLQAFKNKMSKISALDTATQFGEELSFVGVESPSDYLQSLYDRQRLLQVHLPRKFLKGRATNLPTEEWTKEYKRLQHRINFVEKQV